MKEEYKRRILRESLLIKPNDAKLFDLVSSKKDRLPRAAKIFYFKSFILFFIFLRKKNEIENYATISANKHTINLSYLCFYFEKKILLMFNLNIHGRLQY